MGGPTKIGYEPAGFEKGNESAAKLFQIAESTLCFLAGACAGPALVQAIFSLPGAWFGSGPGGAGNLFGTLELSAIAVIVCAIVLVSLKGRSFKLFICGVGVFLSLPLGFLYAFARIFGGMSGIKG